MRRRRTRRAAAGMADVFAEIADTEVPTPAPDVVEADTDDPPAPAEADPPQEPATQEPATSDPVEVDVDVTAGQEAIAATSAAVDNPPATVPAHEQSPALDPAAAQPADELAPAERTWPERIAFLRRDSDGKLAKLVTAPIHDGRRWVLYPTWPCADVAALYSWAVRMLDVVVTARRVTEATDVVHVRGILAGEDAELCAWTNRLTDVGGYRPTGSPGSTRIVPLDELHRIAQLEVLIDELRYDAAGPFAPAPPAVVAPPAAPPRESVVRCPACSRHVYADRRGVMESHYINPHVDAWCAGGGQNATHGFASALAHALGLTDDEQDPAAQRRAAS